MQKLFSLTAACATFVLVGTAYCHSAEAQWGTLKGQVVLDGDIPEIPPLVVKGNQAAKCAAVCAVKEVPDEKLVVDPSTKGIANVFVYLVKKPAMVHPDLEKSTVSEIKFDQKGCRFMPHSMLVRTDQRVRVLSDDAIAHNTRANPTRQEGANFTMSPNDRVGVLMKPLAVVEKLPTKINCDIHTWMVAYWLILDHPYAAVTDEQGRYEIPNLPIGPHEFIIWQESAGYLNKKYSVTIKAGANDQKPLKFTAAQILKD